MSKSQYDEPIEAEEAEDTKPFFAFTVDVDNQRLTKKGYDLVISNQPGGAVRIEFKKRAPEVNPTTAVIRLSE